MSSFIPLLAFFAAGWPMPAPHVRIVLAPDAKLPAAVARAAVEEAAALWAPYGVTILQRNPSVPCGPADGPIEASLTVRVADPPPGAALAWSSPFGSIRFLPSGEPEPTILLHYDAMIRLGLNTVTLGGLREERWPRSLRDRVLGRMIGRVLAHEIGHWTLRSREHSAAGLMRAVQPAWELADPHRQGFVLIPADIARLQALRKNG